MSHTIFESGYNKAESDLIQQNIQTKSLIDRFSSIVQTCFDKIWSGDNSLGLICNEVVSHFNDKIRQAFNESATDISNILYKQ